MSEKEKIWIELNLFSNIRGRIETTKITDDDLKSTYGRLEYIARRKEWATLYKEKNPVFLKEMLTQIMQELQIESNPLWLDIYADKEFEELIINLMNELHIIPINIKQNNKKDPKHGLRKESYGLPKRVEISKLDNAILSNRSGYVDLIYLFDKQTIFRNPYFYRLFEQCFESTSTLGIIDKFIYELKKRADLIHLGPKTFTQKEKMGILYRYYYLINVFSQVKNIIEVPKTEEEVALEWEKLNEYFERNRYFDIGNMIPNRKIKYPGRDAMRFLPSGWLQQQYQKILLFAKYDMDEMEFIEEMRSFISQKKAEGLKLNEIKKALRLFLRQIAMDVFKSTEPSDLAYYMLAIIYGCSRRQIKRAVITEKKIGDEIEAKVIEILSSV